MEKSKIVTLSVSEYAKKIGKTDACVYWQIKKKKLPSGVISKRLEFGKYQIDVENIEELVKFSKRVNKEKNETD